MALSSLLFHLWLKVHCIYRWIHYCKWFLSMLIHRSFFVLSVWLIKYWWRYDTSSPCLFKITLWLWRLWIVEFQFVWMELFFLCNRKQIVDFLMRIKFYFSFQTLLLHFRNNILFNLTKYCRACMKRRMDVDEVREVCKDVEIEQKYSRNKSPLKDNCYRAII